MNRQYTSVPDDVRYFFLPVEPKPASRPVVSRYGTGYGKPFTLFRQTGQPYANAYKARPPIDGPVALSIEVVCTKPKTGKLMHPRGDVDNYAKGVMDIMTISGRFWTHDDAQVISLYTSKRYSDPLDPKDKAGCHIYLYEATDLKPPRLH